MKWRSCVKRAIIEYPNLFKCDEYWQSELMVVEQYFFTSGGGHHMATDSEGNPLGYMTDRSNSEDPYGTLDSSTAKLLGSEDSSIGCGLYFTITKPEGSDNRLRPFNPISGCIYAKPDMNSGPLFDGTWKDLHPDWLVAVIKYLTYAAAWLAVDNCPVEDKDHVVFDMCLELADEVHTQLSKTTKLVDATGPFLEWYDLAIKPMIDLEEVCG